MTKTPRALHTLQFQSSIGWIVMASSSDGISLLHFCGPDPLSDDAIRELLASLQPGSILAAGPTPALLLDVKGAVLRYLTEGTPLPSFPIDTNLGTPFQRKVWKALCEIPFGETRSYLQISEAVERPRSARAVGQACGRNPIAVIIPCHRVVGSWGKLGGYSGGLHIKKALLNLEHPKGPGE